MFSVIAAPAPLTARGKSSANRAFRPRRKAPFAPSSLPDQIRVPWASSWATAGVPNRRAVVCSSGALKDLGTLGGVTSSASAINSAGQIVGYATDANEVANAFLYDGSNMVNLINFIPPNSGWTNLTSAYAINDQGQIAGTGFLADGEYHAFLLSPVSGFILLSSPIFSDGKFSFTVQGLSGQRFAIQASTNLPNWWSLSTNTLTGTSTNFTDSGAADQPVRLYRAQLLP